MGQGADGERKVEACWDFSTGRRVEIEAPNRKSQAYWESSEQDISSIEMHRTANNELSDGG